MLSRSIGRRVLFVVILIFAGMTVLTLQRIVSVERKLTEAVPENALWAASETRRELFNTVEALHGLAEGHRGVTPETVQFRFDILWSRIPIYQGEALSAALADEPELRATVEALGDLLVDLDPAIASLDESPDAAATAMVAADALHAFIIPVHDIVIRSLEHDRDQRMALGRQHREILIAFLTSLGGMILASGLLLALLLRSIGQSRNLVLEAEASRRDAAAAHTQLREALNASSEGFAYYDAEDRLVVCNDRYREIYAATGTALQIGARFEDMLRSGLDLGQYADAEDAEAWLRQRMQEHANPTGPVLQHLGDGRWLQISERRTEDGGTVGIRTDITELKRLQLDLERARDAAEQASRAKSEFLAMMSHEVRTPLNGVLGSLTLLASRQGDDESRRLVQVARSSGEHLLAILNDILDLSKVEAGRLELEEMDFDLAAVVRSAVDLSRALAGAKRLRFAVDIQPTLPVRLYGDPGRLRQMLLNLLSNAVKFTETGTISVSVSLDDCTAGGQDACRIRFAVRDTGAGVVSDRLNRLFDRFVQGDGPIDRRHDGAGLGLAITRELSARMGGSVGAESTPGEGSTFWFTAVLRPASDRPGIVTGGLDIAGPTPPAAISVEGRPPRILVAEDNPTNQLVVRMMLEGLGCHVDVVGNGGEAIDAAAMRPYDLVLMDIAMPEVNGLQATRIIRRLPERAGRVSIVAMTASTMREERERYEAAGMDGCVAKPITATALSSVLMTQIPGATAGQASAGERRVVPAVRETSLNDVVQIDDSPFDPAAIDRLIADTSAAAAPVLIEAYLEDVETTLARIKDAAATGDLTALGRAAHCLVGNSGTYGAVAVQRAASTVERACLASDTDAALAAVGNLVSAGRDVSRHLAPYLENGAPARNQA